MNKKIDCLMIGHNEMEFENYEDACKIMGDNSGSYRDLNLNFIRHNDKSYTVTKVFNLFNKSTNRGFEPLEMVEAFSSAISYLGSYLHRHGLSFDYVNSFQENKPHLEEILGRDNILTIAIITTLYVFPLPILEIIEFIKKHNPTARIIVGGPFVSTKVRSLEFEGLEYLWNTIGADFFVNSSQGEAALVKIIKALKTGSEVKDIENIYYKNGTGYTATPIKIEDNKLHEHPVNWELFSNRVNRHVNDRTAISCAFSDSFCGFPEHAGKYQTTKVDWIETQLNKLESLGTVESIHFIDDTFNVPMRRFKEILKMMIKNKYRFNWHSYCRCQYLDEETAELMKESGCEGVFLGIESGSQQILENMNKRSDISSYRDGITLLKKNGIATFGSFIIGFPGETDETVQETIRFIQETELDFYRVQLWYCDPITPIWREGREKYKIQGESFEWSHATMDSKTACDWVDKAFMSDKKAAWIPQYDFDFASLWYLVHRGIPLEKVAGFLNGFSKGIKEKLLYPDRVNVSSEVMAELAGIFQPAREAGADEPGLVASAETVIDKSKAEFDY
ncbi:MAG: PhpK family radical SAM P-methyltransferase [bacterium]|nr:PhpK family radical SAM P-methyltransferase [bacterium]